MESRSTGGRPRMYSSECERLRIRRQRESQERAARLEGDAARFQRRRENERITRLRDNADRQMRRRQHESLEERTLRLLENSQREQERRELKTSEERVARLAGNLRRLQTRRESDGVEARRRRLQENALRQQQGENRKTSRSGSQMLKLSREDVRLKRWKSERLGHKQRRCASEEDGRLKARKRKHFGGKRMLSDISVVALSRVSVNDLCSYNQTLQPTANDAADFHNPQELH
uniref:Trichohyalin-like n=1 Tax=Haemonchus contortus TaxID=6289 RepID=A0A7I4XSY3_HAECO